MASIKKNYFYSTLLNLSNILLPLITYPYVLRIIGPEGLGKAGFAVSLASYFLIIAQFGLPYFGIKEIAKARDDRTKLNRVFTGLFTVNMIMSIAAAAVYCVFVFSVGKLSSDKILFFAAGLVLIINLFSIDWFYSGLEEYKYIALRSFGVRMLYIVLVFVFIRKPGDYTAYVALTAFMFLAGNAVNMLMMRNKVSFDFKGMNFRPYLKPMTMIFLMGAVASIYSKLDVVILGFLSGDEAVGFYTANKRIIVLSLALVTSLSAVLIPRMSYYAEKGMKAEFNKTAERSVNFLYFASVPVIVLCFAMPSEMLRLLGGVKFLPGELSLQILSFQILLTGLAGMIAAQVMLAHNDEKGMFYASLAGAAVSVPLNLLLAGSMAQNGPSIAILAAEAAVILVQLKLASKYLTFRLIKKQSLYYPVAGLAMYLCAVGLSGVIKTHYIITAGIVGAVSLALYYGILSFVKDENTVIIYNTVREKLWGRK